MSRKYKSLGMSRKYKSLGTGYLYKLYEGELQEYSGEVVIDERYADMLSNVTRGRAYFKVGDSQDDQRKLLHAAILKKKFITEWCGCMNLIKGELHKFSCLMK